MSKTIKAIEHPLRPRSTAQSVERRSANLVAEWQQRGPETLSGLAVRKLRLVLARPQSVITPTPVGAG